MKCQALFSQENTKKITMLSATILLNTLRVKLQFCYKFMYMFVLDYFYKHNIIFIVCVITDSRDYAVPDVTKSALVVALPPIYPPQPPIRGQSSLKSSVDTPPPTYDALYAAADVINAQGLNIPSLQVSPH